jgi:hypothetical protein
MKMNKQNLLPIAAAVLIAMLLFPIIAVPVNAVTPTPSGSRLQVVTIPEDDETRQKGIMVLGLLPTYNVLGSVFTTNPAQIAYTKAATYYQTLAACQAGTSPITTGLIVGPETDPEPVIFIHDSRLDLLTLADTAYAGAVSGMGITTVYYRTLPYGNCEKHKFLPPWGAQAAQSFGVAGLVASMDKPIDFGWDYMSQHKILTTLDGAPVKPDGVLCEVIEKEKTKLPNRGDKGTDIRQFPRENVKTTLIDVSKDFICKYREIKPGVGVLDVYFVGPLVPNYIADHMLIVSVWKRVGRTTLWATEIQDICVLGWAMDDETMGIQKFPLDSDPTKYHWSWPDALGPFVSCEEAAIWQLAWISGGWPPSTVWGK